jgi:hypothetical protein
MSIAQHEINEKLDDIGEVLGDLRFQLQEKLSDNKYYSSRHSDETLLSKIAVINGILDL